MVKANRVKVKEAPVIPVESGSDDDLVRVPTAAKLMEVSESNIRRLLRERKIRRWKFIGVTKVSMKELRSMVRLVQE